MYTRSIFGKELKIKIENKEPVENIGGWAYSMYIRYIEYIDSDFREILLTLTTMEGEPEFAFSYKALNQLADDLIAGKEVDINLENYKHIK